MNRTELFDMILKHLCENYSHFHSLPDFVKNINPFYDKNILDSINEELIERKWIYYKTNHKWFVKIHYRGQQMLDKHKSYSSFLLFLTASQHKTRVHKIFKAIIPHIMTSLSIGVAIYFGWLSHLDKQELKEKDQTISRQQTMTDSLRQLLDRQQKTIDSLKTISNRTDTSTTK